MATDGVKIIDSDTAHDTYWGIMDLYDNDVDFETIFQQFPLVDATPYDDFDNEIYTTACGLAYWEIGQMTPDRLEYIKSIIDKGACVKEWSEQDKKAGVARQNVLDKYLKKISRPNAKIRSRKKYKKVTNLYFQPDDALTFKLKDGNYRVAICALVEQHRGQCDYILVPTTYNSNKKPTVTDLYDKEILGGTISTWGSHEDTLAFQPYVDRVWKTVGGNPNFCFGVVQYSVPHKDFINFKDKFEKIGTLKIIESLKRAKQGGYADTFFEIEERFIDLHSETCSPDIDKYPIKALCEI